MKKRTNSNVSRKDDANKNEKQKDTKGQKQSVKAGSASEEFDSLAREAEKERSKKPGSQSNSSVKQNNNGRGGGK